VPAVAKTTDLDIVRAARAIVEREGAGGLSMQAVANEVGVRAPSLYKRFADRAALLAAVELETLATLGRMLERAASTGTPASDIDAMARAYRRFAKRHPRLYEMLFGAKAPKGEAADRARAEAARPLIERVAQLVGEQRALASARVLTAFVHGFVSMENAGAFRLGEGVDEAFELGMSMLIASLASPR
jgi:AcrR family transcriptional regulator